MSLENLSMDHPRALTFRIGAGRFGIDVSHILAFSDEFQKIRPPVCPSPGFAGFLDYRTHLVQVFQCAVALGADARISTDEDGKSELAQHPVVLHLTDDGSTPWFSLVLEEIDDIIEYEPQQLDKRAESLGNEPVIGYVRHHSGDNFMMLSIDKLHLLLSSLIGDEKTIKEPESNEIESPAL